MGSLVEVEGSPRSAELAEEQLATKVSLSATHTPSGVTSGSLECQLRQKEKDFRAEKSKELEQVRSKLHAAGIRLVAKEKPPSKRRRKVRVYLP